MLSTKSMDVVKSCLFWLSTVHVGYCLQIFLTIFHTYFWKLGFFHLHCRLRSNLPSFKTPFPLVPLHFLFQPSDAKPGTICDHCVYSMAAVALAPWVARSPVAIVLTMLDKDIPVLHEGIFQRLVPSTRWEMIEKNRHIIFFSEINSVR